MNPANNLDFIYHFELDFERASQSWALGERFGGV